MGKPDQINPLTFRVPSFCTRDLIPDTPLKSDFRSFLFGHLMLCTAPTAIIWSEDSVK
jgi:hypothetical protein